MYNVKTCDALWQYVKITISNIGFRWFSNMDLDAGVLKMWEHMYGKLWPLENQALDLKQRASLPENHIPFESLFETSMTKNC